MEINDWTSQEITPKTILMKSFKMTFSLNDNSPLRKVLEMHDVIIVTRSVFNDGIKYKLKLLLDNVLYRLAE